MNYWLDLFTGTTWAEFRRAGATVSGFRERQAGKAARVRPGDIFVCYLTGVMRWVGALQVLGTSGDERRIWKDSAFPVRFEVKPLIMLDAENGIPMQELEGKVSFYSGPKDRGKFKGFVRGSPNLFREPADAELIMERLAEAEQSPVARPVDAKKLARKPYYRVVESKKGRKRTPTVVSVPEPEETREPVPAEDFVEAGTRHTEIQYELLRLGAELGLKVWVARNDRGRKWKGRALGELPHVLDSLPTQFDDATTRTIELIDVLWLAGNSIVAAFEVESTTSIYSGLLRMGDLFSLQPNLAIDLYLVAPDERREKVRQEILRPTFNLGRERPLAKICGFLSFSRIAEQLDGIRRLGHAGSLRPNFLKKVAEYFGDDDGRPAKAGVAKAAYLQ